MLWWKNMKLLPMVLLNKYITSFICSTLDVLFYLKLGIAALLTVADLELMNESTNEEKEYDS